MSPRRAGPRWTSEAGTSAGALPDRAEIAAQTPATWPVAMRIGIARWEE